MSNLAIINANIIPMEGYERYSAVLVKDGLIAALGDDAEISEKAAVLGITPMDAEGNTVIPGLYDCHVHLALTGCDAQGINMYDLPDIPAVVEALRKADAEWEEDRWLYGMRLDESRLAEKRPPVMAELAEFKRPVFISDRGGHYVIVNQLAYDALGIDAETMSGVRLDGNGKPNGRLQDISNKEARNRFPWTDEQIWKGMKETMDKALTKGITTIHCMDSSSIEDNAVDILMAHRDEFPCDVKIWFWCVTDHDDPRNKELGVWGGDIYLDGSIGSRTAAFPTKYEDGDGCGYLNFTDEEVDAMIEGAIMRDYAFSFHAIGQLALEQELHSIERVLTKHPEKKETAKLRLEHFGFPTEDDMKLAAELGVRVSTQPCFDYLRGGPGSVYRTRLGKEREQRAYPLRAMLDAGIIVGGGSDSDITPMDSLLGMHAACNQPYPENNVTPYEALRMYTIDAAKCGWEEKEKGSLKVGKQADMAMLAEDPLQVDPHTIKDIKVLKTIRKGKIVYEA